MDQLGVAQYLTRLALAFDDPDALTRAKHAWLADPAWQELRRDTEDMMVIGDWFELFIAQNFAQEGLLRKAMYIDGAWIDLLLMGLLRDDRCAPPPAPPAE